MRPRLAPIQLAAAPTRLAQLRSASGTASSPGSAAGSPPTPADSGQGHDASNPRLQDHLRAVSANVLGYETAVNAAISASAIHQRRPPPRPPRPPQALMRGSGVLCAAEAAASESPAAAAAAVVRSLSALHAAGAVPGVPIYAAAVRFLVAGGLADTAAALISAMRSPSTADADADTDTDVPPSIPTPYGPLVLPVPRPSWTPSGPANMTTFGSNPNASTSGTTSNSIPAPTSLPAPNSLVYEHLAAHYARAADHAALDALVAAMRHDGLRPTSRTQCAIIRSLVDRRMFAAAISAHSLFSQSILSLSFLAGSSLRLPSDPVISILKHPPSSNRSSQHTMPSLVNHNSTSFAPTPNYVFNICIACAYTKKFDIALKTLAEFISPQSYAYHQPPSTNPVGIHPSVTAKHPTARLAIFMFPIFRYLISAGVKHSDIESVLPFLKMFILNLATFSGNALLASPPASAEEIACVQKLVVRLVGRYLASVEKLGRVDLARQVCALLGISPNASAASAATTYAVGDDDDGVHHTASTTHQPPSKDKKPHCRSHFNVTDEAYIWNPLMRVFARNASKSSDWVHIYNLACANAKDTSPSAASRARTFAVLDPETYACLVHAAMVAKSLPPVFHPMHTATTATLDSNTPEIPSREDVHETMWRHVPSHASEFDHAAAINRVTAPMVAECAKDGRPNVSWSVVDTALSALERHAISHQQADVVNSDCSRDTASASCVSQPVSRPLLDWDAVCAFVSPARDAVLTNASGSRPRVDTILARLSRLVSVFGPSHAISDAIAIHIIDHHIDTCMSSRVDFHGVSRALRMMVDNPAWTPSVPGLVSIVDLMLATGLQQPLIEFHRVLSAITATAAASVSTPATSINADTFVTDRQRSALVVGVLLRAALVPIPSPNVSTVTSTLDLPSESTTTTTCIDTIPPETNTDSSPAPTSTLSHKDINHIMDWVSRHRSVNTDPCFHSEFMRLFRLVV